MRSPLVLALLVALAAGCAARQKPAEDPDWLPKGWSGQETEPAQAKGDHAIQAPALTSAGATKSAPASDPAPTQSSTVAAAIPSDPPPAAPAPTKKHKKTKKRK